MNKTKCQGITKKGTPCPREVKHEKKYCFQHEPKLKRWIKWTTITCFAGAIATAFGFFIDLMDLGKLISFPCTTAMTGEFNIVVASFSAPNGTKSPLGEEIATVFSKRLETELEQYSETNKIVRVFEVLPPSKTGIIKGETAEERVKNAQVCANKVNAHLVVYGIVESRDNGDILISPEFFVATRYIKDAEELLGQYRLGSTITIKESIENLSALLKFNRELADRSSALASVTLGLFNYFNEDYGDALLFYKQADSLPAWEQSTGKEVLNILMGNAAAKNNDLNSAATFYQKAISINKEYARAYIGLATVTFRQAITDPENTDYNKVWEAVRLFEKASTVEDRPTSSFIDFKIHFGLGETKLLLTQAGEAELLDESRGHFQYVVDFYRVNPNIILIDRASQAFVHLGLIAFIQGAPMEQVRSLYEQGIDIAKENDVDLAGRYWEKLALLYINVNDNDSATQALSRAIDVVKDETEKDRLQRELEAILNPSPSPSR